MHVNHSVLGRTVFIVAAFCLDASAKTSSPLPDCHGNISNVNTNVTNYVTAASFLITVSVCIDYFFTRLSLCMLAMSLSLSIWLTTCN